MQSVDEEIVRNRLLVDNRLQKRFFSRILSYRSSGKDADLQYIFLDIYQTQCAILKNDLQRKMNEQELLFYKAEQSAIETQIQTINSEIDDLRKALNKAQRELLLRMEYRPIIEQIRSCPTRSETEKPLVKMTSQVEALNNSKSMLEAAKASCFHNVSLASLALGFAKEALSIEKNIDSTNTPDDNISLESPNVSQMEIG